MPDLTIYNTQECVAALKRWIDAHPEVAAMLFASPEEYLDRVQWAEQGEREYLQFNEADDTRHRLLRPLKKEYA